VSNVRVTCPECEFAFNIAETRVGGLITCRDCQAEFRVEFAEDDPAEPDRTTKAAPDPTSKPRPATRSRHNLDTVPDAWKADVPIGSPVPFFLVLVGLQVLVAAFLAVCWFYPTGGWVSTPTTKTAAAGW
jgi:hypothetical protein